MPNEERIPSVSSTSFWTSFSKDLNANDEASPSASSDWEKLSASLENCADISERLTPRALLTNSLDDFPDLEAVTGVPEAEESAPVEDFVPPGLASPLDFINETTGLGATPDMGGYPDETLL